MEKSEKFWDKSAGSYDSEEMKDKELRFKILEKIRKHLKKGDQVLDYGCATGIVSNEIAGKVNSVLGIDISSAMVEIARKKALEARLENVNFSHSTIFDQHHSGGTYDLILAIYMFHLAEDLSPVLSRISELLKPGGILISVTPCLGKKSISGITLLLISKIGLIPNLKLFTAAGLESLIKNVGFEIMEAECLQQRGQQYFMVAKKVK